MLDENLRLFVDLDGTLAEFKTVDTLETLYEEGYFRNLKPQQSVVDAVNFILEGNYINMMKDSSVESNGLLNRKAGR